MDKYRLQYVMKSKGVSIGKLCDDLHISRSAFYRKCNGKTQFTLSEMQNIVKYLGLKTPVGIFFDDEVSEMTPEKESEAI